jgi:hypothetical protein
LIEKGSTSKPTMRAPSKACVASAGRNVRDGGCRRRRAQRQRRAALGAGARRLESASGFAADRRRVGASFAVLVRRLSSRRVAQPARARWHRHGQHSTPRARAVYAGGAEISQARPRAARPRAPRRCGT